MAEKLFFVALAIAVFLAGVFAMRQARAPGDPRPVCTCHSETR